MLCLICVFYREWSTFVNIANSVDKICCHLCYDLHFMCFWEML